ncbi:Small RNA 2'-O-methyltransferase [Linum grandiflorum]
MKNKFRCFNFVLVVFKCSFVVLNHCLVNIHTDLLLIFLFGCVKFISSLHPLTGHLKGAFCRDGDLCGSVPCSVFAVSDTKISTICKSMDPNVDLNPFLALPIIMNAAARIPSVVVSEKRIVGRASSETRLYYAAPESHLLELSSDRVPVKDVHLEGSCNARASYFCGQVIHGDAIMASIGYTWRSTDLFYENLTMQMYHRILLSTFPSGTYKLSREAVLAAELPSQFTTKAYWKGSFPREVLCTFCRLHRLSEPVLSVISMPSAESGLSRLHKKVKLKETSTPPVGSLNEIPAATGDTDLADSGSTFRCEIKIYSKLQDLLMECSPSETYKKQSDSVHNASLKVLSWLSTYFNNVGMPLERLNSYAEDLAIEGEETKELLERKDEFEFEIGTGAVVSPLEAVVTQMSVGQSALFHTRLPPEYSILAAGNDSGRLLSLISSCRCYLQFSVTLLHVTEPSEERMEQALFSPPLSKQRVEFAVQHIRNSSAASLVDFGCGSGSLLDSLLDYPISLETIVGVDISLKGLTRAAKILNSKLAAKTDMAVKTAILYEGSITVYDSRLHGVDIGTCLEVIEHMEEEEASQFGDVVLSHFRPRILIVSTPNYEYNPILQKSGNQEEDADEKSNIKFRNLDHKFEWTRQQFSEWACQLGDKHSYDVEFGGVGGTAGVEPGFASQIAVFKRKEGSGTETETNNNCSEETETETNNNCSEETYNVIWEWKSSVQE